MVLFYRIRRRLELAVAVERVDTLNENVPKKINAGTHLERVQSTLNELVVYTFQSVFRSS